MRLVRFKTAGEVAWGLLGDDEATLHHVAGAFRAWSPRIAGGEGAHALPRTGRRHALADVELLAPVEDDAAIHDGRSARLAGPAVSVAGPRSIETSFGAALVGAPLAGRLNPLRSVFGYARAWRSGRSGAPAIALSPIVTTCGRCDPDPAVAGALAQDLARLDARAALRPGDLVLFDLATEASLAAEPPILAARVA